LYSILNEFGVPKKLLKIIKVSLNETYRKVRIGKNLSDTFLIRSETRRHFIAIDFKLCLRMCHLKYTRKRGRTEIE